MEKFFVATYLLRISKDNNGQLLNKFNGNDDFLVFFESFLSSLLSLAFSRKGTSDSLERFLSLDGMPTVDFEKRVAYGFFSTGIGGDEYLIKDSITNQQIAQVQKNHAAFRELFFYLKLPIGNTDGFLILERKANFGIKTILHDALKEKFNAGGYLQYKLIINSVLNGSVFNKMLHYGKLNKIELIKRTIPSTLEEHINNDFEAERIYGKLTTTISSSFGLPDAFKESISSLMTKKPKHHGTTIEICNKEYDEVQFELELHGKKKTFYMVNRERTLPDIEIGSELIYKNGRPTIESLISQCEDIIDEILTIKLEDVTED